MDLNRSQFHSKKLSNTYSWVSQFIKVKISNQLLPILHSFLLLVLIKLKKSIFKISNISKFLIDHSPFRVPQLLSFHTTVVFKLKILKQMPTIDPRCSRHRVKCRASLRTTSCVSITYLDLPYTFCNDF